ncbi:ATP synthase F1 subunit delta [Tepidimonas fonticaldi]|uniref:ATP synthase subunit delta n=1 Tax=Tepidimonas fonticaldi TaxID=1101373 RepID=A0A1A6DXN7_9BURK|nr:F0F1 ATP synthase subunit delta [Tepidimonas fonticaldi]OBS31529.1 ATP synthase F1 subunit delta [Tepidimonas fonticaldi]
MAELATIARPYAEALFKAAAAQAADASEWLDELAAIAGQEQLQAFAADPKVRAEQVFDVITGVMKAPLPEIGRNFLRTVIDNDRVPALPEIARQFRELVNAQRGVADATVESAFPIEAAQLADLQGVLEKRFGRQLRLQVQLRPELIGGVRVVVGDEVLDTSVKARLEQMRVALTA